MRLRPLLILTMAGLGIPLFAQNKVIKFAYAIGNAPPYAFVENGELKGGLIQDMGEWLAKHLRVKADFVFTSRLRTDSDLDSRRFDVLPISNPAWIQAGDSVQWTRELFKENNVFVDSADSPCPVGSAKDLIGKKVGTILGYVYPRKLEEAFQRGGVLRDDVVSLKQNLKKLEAGRIDLVYDSDVVLQYAQMDHENIFRIQPYRITSSWPIRMAVSKSCPVSFERFENAVEAMVQREL